jgi:hypothetical protein
MNFSGLSVGKAGYAICNALVRGSRSEHSVLEVRSLAGWLDLHLRLQRNAMVAVDWVESNFLSKLMQRTNREEEEGGN